SGGAMHAAGKLQLVRYRTRLDTTERSALAQHPQYRRSINIRHDLRLPYPAPQHQSQTAADILLVQTHQVEQSLRVDSSWNRCRQSEAREQRLQTVGVGGARALQLGRQSRGVQHADCDGLAMQQHTVACGSFERMPERVAEVQQ